MKGKGNGSSLQEKTSHTYTLRDHARVDFLSCIKKRKKSNHVTKMVIQASTQNIFVTCFSQSNCTTQWKYRLSISF